MIFPFSLIYRRTKIVWTAFWLLAWPALAPAHTLKTDGQVGVIFHLQPNDQPRVDQETSLYLEFSDRQKIFRLSDCECYVSITQNHQEILRKKLSSTSQKNPNQAKLPVTFAHPGSYEIRMEGQPRSPNTFRSFDLKYAVQVVKPRQYTAKQKQIATTIYHSLHYGSIGVGALFVMWHTYRDWRKRKKS